ncbi:hypothetical protein BN946_scf184748.g14 [Trametes cinnabarina]|uniref:Uncharacterized protein n=1 Tax=Pycnoporus cinnabarinus TaxID=5643 RepID=A0A060S7Z4_PYCCI|nr:hypothetical protein BN946_scf184748.g14 [Trametes cinnabarina]
MPQPAVIRFPPPPPTRNELTPEQRAKLIRTNNKLGQVLGSTPHVLDSTYRVPKPSSRDDFPSPSSPPTSTRNPFRTHSRSKSLPQADMDALRANSPDSVSSGGSVSSRKSSTSTRSLPVSDPEREWRSPYPVAGERPPLLKLSAPSPSRKPRLETIPGSPPFDKLAATIDPPTFTIPSDAAMRREKMRRLRRKLGDNVPVDLVFSSPEESESEEDSPLVSTPTSSVSRDWLVSDKPLPEKPRVVVHEVAERPLPQLPSAKEKKSSWAAGRRLFKSRPKTKPSEGAVRLDSITENGSGKEAIVCVGVSASAGVDGFGKSRRFVHGSQLHLDQIGTAWGGTFYNW